MGFFAKEKGGKPIGKVILLHVDDISPNPAQPRREFDPEALAGLADASLYVVRSGTAQVSHILDSLQFLAGSGTPLMGCVLNGASGGGGRYGYGYGYGYGGDHYGKYHAYRQEK